MKLHEMRALNLQRPALGVSFQKRNVISQTLTQLPGKAAGSDSENNHRLPLRRIRRRPAGRLGGTFREVLAVTSSFLKRDPQGRANQSRKVCLIQTQSAFR